MQNKEYYPLVLIADDDHKLIKQASSFLTKNKFRVLTALSSKQALGLAFSKKPDLVIIDLFMPGIDGETFKVLLAMNPETHNTRVLFTANDFVHGKPEKWRHLSIDDIIFKPVEPNELISTIRFKIKQNSSENKSNTLIETKY